MDPRTARRFNRALDPLHSMIFFAPELESALTGLGLQSGAMCYFAARSAPMGAVGSGPVAATFYVFNPATVARHLPTAWSITTPEQVLSARAEAAEAALRRLLGEAAAASPEAREVARLLREACAACAAPGRPLYAANADLPWPAEQGQAHLVLWHAMTLLREYRGDGHITALQSAGLDGLESLVLHTASDEGKAKGWVMNSRDWSEQEWRAAADRLRERDLLDEHDALTDAGAELREEVEQATDRLDRAPWEQLGPGGCERLFDLGRPLTHAIIKAGAFPQRLFKPSTPAGR